MNMKFVFPKLGMHTVAISNLLNVERVRSRSLQGSPVRELRCGSKDNKGSCSRFRSITESNSQI